MAEQAAPLPILVSIAPQKYLLERIAGDSVSITVLVKPGNDPHSYEPEPSQMRQAALAKAWFTFGVPFEDVWLERIKGVSPNLRVISCIEGIRRLRNDDAEHDPSHDHGQEAGGAQSHARAHGEFDPHVWLSPMLVREMLPRMARELGKLLPERKAAFMDKARAFAEELERLDRDLAMRFAQVPERDRVFLTFHPAWRYFALNYALHEVSIEVEGKEPGPKRMKEIADMAAKRGIRAIFVEPQFPRSVSTAIAESLGAKVIVADPLAEDLPRLYLDFAAKLLESFPKPTGKGE
jgi:zinc transport system substrate-binding protein